jgi:excisionase family DNA binding protein
MEGSGTGLTVSGQNAHGAPSGERLLGPEELAGYLGVPVKTIYRWRYRGEGPASYRVGRHVRYKFEDVEVWLQARRERNGRTAS